jgi:predicted DsbA family dithiol-disulfide isomerase
VSALTPVRLTVWSDVLCPWCYNGAVRLARISEELGDAVSIAWKAYLLRPTPKQRSLERFREYTQTWLVPASAPEGGRFRVWTSDEGPPSHSVPAQVACKAAARQDGFHRYHLALMDAYFWDNRDVSRADVQADVARACGLDVARFAADLDDHVLEQEVVRDYRDAVERGITAVPSVVVDDEWVIPGAQDLLFYRRVVEKRRALQAGAA